MSSAYGQYRQTAIQTAPPERLVLMLYDGLIRFLAQVKVDWQEGNPGNQPLERAQDIIIELASALDPSAGDVADHLAQLYEFWLRWLTTAQAARDPEKVEQVLAMVRDLRDAWGTVALQKRVPAAGEAEPLGALNVRS